MSVSAGVPDPTPPPIFDLPFELAPEALAVLETGLEWRKASDDLGVYWAGRNGQGGKLIPLLDARGRAQMLLDDALRSYSKSRRRLP